MIRTHEEKMNMSNISKPKPVNDKAMQYNCEGALNTFTVNKDFTQVVVAGRTVFKILTIKEDCFLENTNLRSGKKLDLNYSAADVAWHPSDENILASAATNGAVVIWNLGHNARSKLTSVYTDHERAVNRVVFHGQEHNRLLSASIDGICMLHDVRMDKVCAKFRSNDSVKDAQFCPPNLEYFTFAAAHDNGLVQIWDMRQPDRCQKRFIAHNRSVFSIDWQPLDNSCWLATAGHDKMIKVWDMQRWSERDFRPTNTITNIAPVARVKWRPQRKNHISSCSLQIDHSINVWELGRPYIPFATFDGHQDVAQCIIWRDPHVFLSCGKDGYIIQHTFNGAKRPAEELNLAGVDLSINGDIGYAFSDKNDPPTGSLGRIKRVSRSRQFTLASSSLCVFQRNSMEDEEDIERDKLSLSSEAAINKPILAEEEMMMLCLYEIAQEYILEGKSIEDMCWHNGKVAECFRKPQVAQSWRMLAEIYSPRLISQSNHSSRTSSIGKRNQTTQKVLQNKVSATKANKPVMKRTREKEKRKTSQPTLHSEATSGSNDDSSEVEGESSEIETKNSVDIMNAGINFWFGDGEFSDAFGGGGEMNGDNYDWKSHMLPYEGFQPRHELNAMTGTHPIVEEEAELALAPKVNALHVMTDAPEQNILVMTVKCSPEMESIDFSSIVADVIKSFAEQGDVQTAVSMLVVLGDQPRRHIDVAYQETWFFSYIDLLGRFELWTIANTVIKHSKLLGVRTLNQNSTMIHTMCAKCSKKCERTAWLCDKCKRITGLCSICHHPVKGLMVWCQGCCHGGHMEHMREWMAVSTSCPAGCGHQCEYV